MTEAELVRGDCIRKRGKPPFSVLRHWQRSDQAPPLAVCESAYQTLDAFRQTFTLPSGASLPAAQWRQKLPCLDNPKSRTAGVLCAMLMLSATLDGVAAYRSDEKLSPVRGAAEAALGLLRAGRLDEVLRTADQTDQATRKALAEDMATMWGGMKVVEVLDLGKVTFVFLDSADQSGLFATFLFQRPPGRAVLKRIDAMNLWDYYDYKRQGG